MLGARSLQAMDQLTSPGPLDGIRVVDLTTARSGPTCVRQLVDMGATAIRVGAANRGDLAGSDGWNLHRGKRSVLLDLTTPAGLEVLQRLAADADVFVENFRPGVKHRLKIDPESLWSINPRLIYGSISGFGQTGPYADRPGVDQIAQGLAGLMSVTGPSGTGPWRVGIAISDTVSGTFLAQAIVAALFARTRTGRGQWVHTSLLETMVNIMDFQAARYLNEGEVPGQAGNDHPTLFPMGTYRTADGHINIAASLDFDAFARAVGRAEWMTDDRFSSFRVRMQNRSALEAAVDEVLRQEPTDHWVEILNRVGIPAGPVLAVDETFADPQVQHLSLSSVVPGPGGAEPVTLLRHPVTFTDTPTSLDDGPPTLGQHTIEVLGELGYSPEEIAALIESGAASVATRSGARVV